MCEKGVNTDQLKLAIGQVDDTLALAQQWLEQLHHLADHGHLSDMSADLAQVTVSLGEARNKLAHAMGDQATGTDTVTVELV